MTPKPGCPSQGTLCTVAIPGFTAGFCFCVAGVGAIVCVYKRALVAPHVASSLPGHGALTGLETTSLHWEGRGWAPCLCEPLPLNTLSSKAVTNAAQCPTMHKTAPTPKQCLPFSPGLSFQGGGGKSARIGTFCINVFHSLSPTRSSPKNEQCSPGAGKPGRWGAGWTGPRLFTGHSWPPEGQDAFALEN